ncbi:hypothetical protein J0H58_20410 [bacterium]|nr:hypothetical protein [bacterium]
MSNDDVISVLKGAGVAAVGAALTYASQWASGADFGALTPAVVATLSVVTNLFRKWVSQ